MKRTKIIVLIVVLLMFLTACGDREIPVPEQNTPTAVGKKDVEKTVSPIVANPGNDISPSPEMVGKQRLQLEPTKVPTPSVASEKLIIIDADDHISTELQGQHNQDEYVTIKVSFGVCDVDKMFREQYPEVYEAYQMYQNSAGSEYGQFWPTSMIEKYGDRVEELVLKGSELNNTLGAKWYAEQEAAFFSRHPELEKCKIGGFQSIELKLCYKDLATILSDPAVEMITPIDKEWHKPHVVGMYQGKEVYDLTAKVTRAFLCEDPISGRIDSDVYGLSEIDDNAFLRVSFVLQKGYEDSDDEGRVKLDAAFETLMGYDWPVVELVDVGRPLSTPCGTSGRYLTVLATKEQLENIVIPDTSLYYFVCWEGYIRGTFLESEDGSVLAED